MSKEELERLEREKYIVARKLTAGMYRENIFGMICIVLLDKINIEKVKSYKFNIIDRLYFH